MISQRSSIPPIFNYYSPIILITNRMEKSKTKERAQSTALPSTHLPKIYPFNAAVNFKAKHPPSRKLFDHNTSVLIKKGESLKRRLVTQVITSARVQTSSRQRKQQLGSIGHRMMEGEIEQAAEMFKKINNLRQQYGVVSLDDEDEEPQATESHEIPYNPELHKMNEQICSIKAQIQDKMSRVFQIAKYYPKIRTTIESMLQEQTGSALLENKKVGKVASMKAQRRLIMASQEELKKIGKL